MPRGNSHKLIVRALQLLLRPLMRFCLRHSLKIQEILEAAKVALLDAAAEELEAAGQEVNISRLMVATGIHRRDVMRIYREEDIEDDSTNLVMRILGQWQSDSRFCGSRGPRTLSCGGDSSEFADLVRAVTNDVHQTTVLFELERLGLVEQSERGLRLLGATYIPKGNPEESFEIVGDDVDYLIQAAEENILNPKKIPNLHGRTEYDNIRKDALPKIREWFYEEGSRFHKRAREYLSQFDLDIHPDPSYRSQRFKAVVGAFGLIQTAAGSRTASLEKKRRKQ